MKNLKMKLWFISIAIIFMVPFFIINPIVPVMAAEEDEEDNFTSMPNYRWFNETTTDSNVREQLISNDVYQISNINNETSGNQKFEKSRALNSRDLYFDARFNMDIDGSEVEYFRDVRGDDADFVEDLEGITTSGAGSISFSNGLLIDEMIIDTAAYSKIIVGNVDFGQQIYSKLEIKARAVVATGFQVSIKEVSYGKDWSVLIPLFSTYPLTDSWTIITVYLNSAGWNNSRVTNFDFTLYKNNGVGISNYEIGEMVYIDYIKIIGDLDYATHVESGIEDTRDWEDSLEYWYDEESNISDFNDGTQEMWVANNSETSVSIENGWLKMEAIPPFTETAFELSAPGLSIDSSVYHWLTIEADLGAGSVWVDTLNVYDSANNLLATDTTDIDGSAFYLYNLDLSGASWTGTETEISLEFIPVDAFENGYLLNLNFTFVYDCELGDVEGFSTGAGWSGDYHYTHPEGYYTSKMDAGSGGGDNLGSYASMNYPTDVFTHISIKIRGLDGGAYQVFGYDENSVLRTLSVVYTLTNNNWDERVIDLTDYSAYYVGEYIYIYIRVYEKGLDGSFEGDEIYQIDYRLLLGAFDNEEGFKYSLLNREHEEGVVFEFTRNNDESSSYNFTVDMMDSVGTALHYSEQFNYSLSDGWLDLSVELNLNKKKIKLTFEYENGTDIISIRSLYEMYGSIGTPNLKILDIGFPHLCINGSIDAMSRYTVEIDYIDACWVIHDWQQPDGRAPVDYGAGIYYDQDLYSAEIQTAYNIDLYDDLYTAPPFGRETSWFMLNVDRFDGVGMDITMLAEGVESSDNIKTKIHICNVRANGSLDHLMAFSIRTGYYLSSPYTEYRYYWWDDAGTMNYPIIDTYSGLEAQASLNIYLDTVNNQLISQVKVDAGATDTKQSINVSRTEVITSEMVIFVLTMITDDQVSGNTDHFRMQISGFDLVRKDLVGDLVAGILSPLVEGLTFIVSLILIPFMWILAGLVKVGQFIVEGLSPIITAVSDALGGVINAATGVLDAAISAMKAGLEAAIGSLETVMDGIASTLGSLAEGIWAQLLTLTSSFTDFIEDILVGLVAVLSTIADEYIAWLVGFYEDIINDLLFVIFDAVIASLGLTELITLMLDYFTDILEILGSLITLVTVIMGYFFEAAAYWLQPANFEAAMLTIIALIGVWLFIPIVRLWFLFVDDKASFEDIGDCFEEVFNKIVKLTSFMVTFITYVFELMFNLLTVIGGFIPLT